MLRNFTITKLTSAPFRFLTLPSPELRHYLFFFKIHIFLNDLCILVVSTNPCHQQWSDTPVGPLSCHSGGICGQTFKVFRIISTGGSLFSSSILLIMKWLGVSSPYFFCSTFSGDHNYTNSSGHDMLNLWNSTILY